MISFLLIGQSNMAGRGDMGEVEPIDNPLCKMLRNGRFQKMSEPINPDRGVFTGTYRSGIGLSASFADAYAKEYGEEIGLIPCADGGSSLSEWQPGEILFDHAVMQTKLALRSSTLGGILWHQGEADGRPDRAPLYYDRFVKMITEMKRQLGVGDVPVIVGELSKFQKFRPKADPPSIEVVNDALRACAMNLPNTAFVPSDGLTARVDGLHFCSASYREFGLRYFAAYKNLREKIGNE